MKKYLCYVAKLFLLMMLTSFSRNMAQVTIYQENFEGFTNGILSNVTLGGWVADFPYTCNNRSYWSFYNSQVNITNRSLMISAVQKDCALWIGTYFVAIERETIANTTINASNYENLTLDFDWRCQGEWINKNVYDYGQVVYRVGTSGAWLPLDTGGYANGKYYRTPNTAHQKVDLPGVLNDTNFQLGFRWINDGNGGSSPSFVVDNILVKGILKSCSQVTANASKSIVCSGENVNLSATNSTTGYTYTWYTDWNNDTHAGSLVGTGASINVNPVSSTLYGVVATKAGCPTGMDATYDLISISVTPAPTLVVLDPVSAITCSNELRQINVVSGGGIPNKSLDESWDPIKNPWTTSANVGFGGNQSNALWYVYASGGIASPNNSNFAMVDSDKAGNFTIDSNLFSAPISLLDYNTPVNLTFNHYYSTYNNYPSWYSTATVEISEDGQNWSVLKTYTGSDVGGPASFASESINLNPYAGKSFLLLRFHYVGRYDDVWAVDDIKITGNPKSTTITWSPTTGLFTDAARTPYTGGHATTLYASPANTSTYTVAAKTAVGCPANTTVTVGRGDKLWGGTNQNWNTASNWSEGTVPTADHCVNIPNTAQKPTITVGTNAFAKNVTVKSGGGLVINGNLTVSDFVKNEATDADLVIASDGNLKQITDVPASPNTGSATAKRNIKFRNSTRAEYNYLISPVVGQRLNTIYPGISYVLYHNEVNNMFGNSSGAYIPGRGLAVKEATMAGVSTNNVDATFKGALANGVINFRLAYTDAAHGYNLVGNPYPSNINLQTFYTLNSGKISSTFYFWDNAANDAAGQQQQGSGYSGRAYAVYNASNNTGNEAGYLLSGSPLIGSKKPNAVAKVGQGFMVRALGVGTNLVFNNSIRTTDNTGASFFSKPADSTANRYWLRLITPTGLVNTIGVVYYEGGSASFGMDDSEMNVDASDMLYSMADDRRLQIEGRPVFENTEKINLGSHHFAAGNYTLSLGDKEGIFGSSQNIYLKDKQTGTVTNLSEGEYTFAANAGESTGRFEIIYKPEIVLVTDSARKEELIVYRDAQDFIIRAQTKKISDVEVYDSSGRMIYKMQPHDTTAVIHSAFMPQGVYILKITAADGAIISKKILK